MAFDINNVSIADLKPLFEAQVMARIGQAFGERQAAPKLQRAAVFNQGIGDAVSIQQRFLLAAIQEKQRQAALQAAARQKQIENYNEWLRSVGSYNSAQAAMAKVRADQERRAKIGEVLYNLPPGASAEDKQRALGAAGLGDAALSVDKTPLVNIQNEQAAAAEIARRSKLEGTYLDKNLKTSEQIQNSAAIAAQQVANYQLMEDIITKYDPAMAQVTPDANAAFKKGLNAILPDKLKAFDEGKLGAEEALKAMANKAARWVLENEPGTRTDLDFTEARRQVGSVEDTVPGALVKLKISKELGKKAIEEAQFDQLLRDELRRNNPGIDPMMTYEYRDRIDAYRREHRLFTPEFRDEIDNLLRSKPGIPGGTGDRNTRYGTYNTDPRAAVAAGQSSIQSTPTPQPSVAQVPTVTAIPQTAQPMALPQAQAQRPRTQQNAGGGIQPAAPQVDRSAPQASAQGLNNLPNLQGNVGGQISMDLPTNPRQKVTGTFAGYFAELDRRIAQNGVVSTLKNTILKMPTMMRSIAESGDEVAIRNLISLFTEPQIVDLLNTIPEGSEEAQAIEPILRAFVDLPR